MICEFRDKILEITDSNFEAASLELFRFQYEQNPVYQQFVQALNIDVSQVNSIKQIPFLPVSFFKSHRIVTTNFSSEAVFESSGTTGSVNSKHYVKSLALYRKSFIHAFEQAYGELKNWCVIGLLPSYLERSNASLVVMVDEMIRLSAHPQSGFYLHEFNKLATTLADLETKKQPVVLIGVTFALLDFAEKYPMALKYTRIMETGGMKGRRQEITREEVHDILKKAFGLEQIDSEYGMTELLSQAYANGRGVFRCPPWMRILLRDEDDPLNVHAAEKNPVSGLINIIDLANVYSCAFIATDDIGKLYHDKSFEVLGRMDNSDVRGCSLMVL
jgi:phenylacetate-coenzyme A ligase PaaK-like adenylate-forming protein